MRNRSKLPMFTNILGGARQRRGQSPHAPRGERKTSCGGLRPPPFDAANLGSTRLLRRFLVPAFAACLTCVTSAKALDADLVATAKTTLAGIQNNSFAFGREYCGMIGRNAKGNLVVSRPRAGRAGSCRPRNLSVLHGKVEELASYHTHGSHDPRMDGEVPSLDDLRADAFEGVLGFVATPGGRLWVIEPKYDRVRLLCGPGCLPVDTNYNPSDTGPVRDSYTARQLRKRAHGHDH